METFDDGRPFRASEALAAGRLTRGVLRGPRYRKLGADAPDQPATSAHTREALGWSPTHPSLLDDLGVLQRP